ncbi:porin [Opitutales bacterium]|nr:porin [Opitutales bacterium]
MRVFKQTNKQIDMKNKLLAVMATLSMVASASAVKVNDNLSINGFIDGSYASSDDGTANGKKQSLEIDEVELNFVTNVGNVSGLIAVDANPNADYDNASNDTENLGIEQAHFTYNINDTVSVTFGRYGSALGFEREDPAGLYTYSRAYSTNAFNLGDVDNNAVDGLTLAYTGDAYSVAVSLENQVGQEHLLETNDLDFEISFTYTGIAGLNIGGGFLVDNEATSALETDVVNVHLSRQFGKLLVAGEYTELSADAGDRDAYLVLADYDVNNKLGVALRISSEELVNNGGDYDKVTIAPNYAITESLGAILEYSDVDNGGTDSEEYAVELTYTF